LISREAEEEDARGALSMNLLRYRPSTVHLSEPLPVCKESKKAFDARTLGAKF
jgi:hypothetical protein